jgi:excisionase family DNA binding protein
VKRNQNGQRFATTVEVASALGFSPITVRRWIAQGRIPAFRPNGTRGRLVIPRTWLDGHPFGDQPRAATSPNAASRRLAQHTGIAGDEQVRKREP